MESDNKKDSFICYRSFYEATKKLDHETLGKFFVALCEYALNQNEVDLDPSIEALLILVKPQIDANYRKWEGSKKGGAKKGTVNNPKGKNQYSIATNEEDEEIGKPEDNLGKTIGITNVNASINEDVHVNEYVNGDETVILPSSHSGNPVISLPLNKTNTYKPIYEEDLTYYSVLYPNVDILQEFRNMVGWLNANPTKKKTAKGIDKFINNWLCGKQDKGNRPIHRGTAKSSLSIEDMQRLKGEIE